MNKLNKNQIAFLEAAKKTFGDKQIFNREEIDKIVSENDVPTPWWLINKEEYRYDRGLYKIPSFEIEVIEVAVPAQSDSIELAQIVHLRQPKLVDDNEPTVPSKYPDYVPFGFYKDLTNVIKSKQFYPVFITGLSGNGKTLMVEQVCAVLHRELIRVNISIETDESDLIGGPTLINGNVVNRDGPVLTAMKRGAVLLIDEVDRGSNKLMCLQGILEGKPYYNKKTGEVVHPQDGFNIIATANTKGRGSEEGRYLSQILDDAFLERFPITVEQEYPDTKTEKKILTPLIDDAEFVENLVKFADIVRKTFEEGAVDELISTRRLVHIAKAYTIFKDKTKAIELCINRFDTETKLGFMDLYSKISTPEPEPEVSVEEVTQTNEEVPF